ncbi:MAG: amidophosphoribosyltransferase [Candidatus Hydrogenedentes bacterium]|nr:amidophosphoribosyltransferase [Candidatus Hydrogenedentota bacterium]
MTREELDALIANPPPLYQHRLIPSEKGDHMRDECGVFAVFGHEEAARLTYLGLYALQHRGQEGAGIVCAHHGELTAHRGVGLVSDVFKPHKLARVKGDVGIGHVRYSTFGTSNLRNVQPLVADYARGSVAVAHNGNLVNASVLREQLEEMGAIFQSTTDTEVIIHRISRSQGADFTESVIDSLSGLMGAYSVVVMNGEEIVAARDPLGFRPLWLGELDGAYIVASETCALDIIDADYVREIEPGEVITLNRDGMRSQKPFPPVVPKQCIFEFIYVSRPDSDIFGRPVDEVRKAFGAALATQAPVDADIVMAVPDSSNPAALGYSHASGIPFDMGIIRNHYVGRTFIEPEQGIRDFGVKIKLNPSRSAIEGKRIVLVDDSIVRGTTARKIIKMLRRNGAKEIHFRVSSPEIINSCFYGIDTSNPSKLIAHNMNAEEIRGFLGVDSLSYLSIENMLAATKCNPDHFCLGCFTSKYPTPTPHDFLPSRNNHRHVDHSMEVYAQ